MKPNPEGYVVLDICSKKTYVKEGSMRSLGMIDAVIFDCDGVLIDVRGYNKAISEAAAYIFECLTGYRIPRSLVTDEIIFLFRKSGGFNNDWDIVYGILMFLLCHLPGKMRRKLKEAAETLLHEENAAKRLLMAKEKIRGEANGLSLSFLGKLAARLRDFTSQLDVTGVASVDKALLDSGVASRDFYISVRNFLQGSKKVGGSIIETVAEEIFCGPKLFEEIYGVKPMVYWGQGMIENGKPIIKRETLKRLSSILGDGKLGVASGSRFKPAERILQDLLASFNPKALIFLDRIEEAERRVKVNLKKPNPFSLFEAARALEPFRFILYVGDSMEDAIMVSEARKSDLRFLSAGVYEYTNVREEAVKEFLKYGCDLILPSVNEIPYVIEAIRGGMI